MKITDLKEDPSNPRSITPQALNALGKSLDEFGDLSGIVWNRRTGELVCGHQRIRALREKYGDERAIPFLADDGEVREIEVVQPGDCEEVILRVPVRTVDWPREKQKIANIVANSPLIAGTFTGSAIDIIGELEAELPELSEGMLLGDLKAKIEDELPTTEPETGLTDPDAVPATPEVPITKPGDLWILGNHRLLCGDSTSKEDLSRLMAGDKANLLSTDPPYCVDYTGMDRPIHDGKPSGKDWSHVYHEVDIKDLGEFMDRVFKACLPCIEQDAAIYIWHAHVQQPTIAEVFEQHNILLHQVIVWVKPVATFGHSYYRWRHEPCAFGWRRGHKPAHGLGKLDSVWEVDWEGKSRIVGNEHPTQKPLRLFEIPMEQHTRPGAVILEPFSGSGSQLIAAERLRRKCRAMELEPAFVDVAVRRWEEFTGKKGKKISGERER